MNNYLNQQSIQDKHIEKYLVELYQTGKINLKHLTTTKQNNLLGDLVMRKYDLVLVETKSNKYLEFRTVFEKYTGYIFHVKKEDL